jgi:hypothetical protein
MFFNPFNISALAFGNIVEPEKLRCIDLSPASQYFQEFASVCEKDNGALWGISLQGPMIFVASESRSVVANQADTEGRLTRHGNLFVGTISDDIGVANTAAIWSGVKWTMIIWHALSDNKEERIRLMAHESFHRIQDEIGFPGSMPANRHLDTLNGRLWLQLEWRALEQALRTGGQERHKAIEDALIFRTYRQSLFPGSASEERALEMNEGLAEYTAVKLSNMSNLALANRIKSEPTRRESFTRSFAYVSGPMYGVLLDESGADWCQSLKPEDDFGVLLREAFDINLPKNLAEEADKRSIDYGGVELRTIEVERDRKRQEQITAYRARLIDGPILIVLLSEEMGYVFNPNELMPLSDQETIFPTIQLRDAWGILNVSSGGLFMDRKREIAHVSAPTDPEAHPLEGDGWTLKLYDGWTLQRSECEGDYVLLKT